MLPTLLALLVSLVPSFVWRAEGRAEAERDIAAGTMKWKVYGYMAGIRHGDEVAREKMRERLGVELWAVAQCVVTDELVERTKGYNERIREQVEKGHGAHAIDRVWEEAGQETRREHVALPWASVLCLVAAALWIVLRVRVSRRKRDV